MTGFFSKTKKQKLKDRLAALVAREDDLLASYLTKNQKRSGRRYPEDWHEIIAAFEGMCYPLDEHSVLLSYTFVWEVREVWEKFQGQNIPPGILCTKVIDSMMRMSNVMGECHPYPPDFVTHRDRLREKERINEQCVHSMGEVRA